MPVTDEVNYITRRDRVWTRRPPEPKIMSNLPLPALYSRTLANASKAAALPTIDDETQVFL